MDRLLYPRGGCANDFWLAHLRPILGPSRIVGAVATASRRTGCGLSGKRGRDVHGARRVRSPDLMNWSGGD